MIGANLWLPPGTAQQNAARRQWGWFIVALILALVAAAAWIALLPGDAHLQAPWIFVAVILTAFCALAGVLINGRIDGILIDDRNRVGLSRLQWVTWFVVLLGGYFTEAVWNTAHRYAYPLMQEDLFILLGIVSASAVVSNVIVDNKKTAIAQQPPQQPNIPLQSPAQPPPQPGQPDQIGSIDRNATIQEASWADLFMGEEVANRDVVDISRLQKLVITILLVITYVKLLWDALGDIALTAPDPTLTDAVKKAYSAGFNMPTVNNTFLWLLGISHAAYLAFKATPKSGPGTAGAAAGSGQALPGPALAPAQLNAEDSIDGCDVDFTANPTPDQELPGATGGVA